MEQKKTNKASREQSGKSESDRKNEDRNKKPAQGQGKERSR